MSKRARRESEALIAEQTHEATAKKHTLDTAAAAPDVMWCSLPPHRETLSFTSYEDYEAHYLQFHVNRCADCGKNFPTTHFMNLHIEENHDSLVATRRDRGEKTYACFVEDCDRKCSTPQKRRMHLIDKHMFPKTYNFYIVKDGIDKQSSMLRPAPSHRRRISTSTAISASNTASTAQEGRLRRRQSSYSSPAGPVKDLQCASVVSHLPSSSTAQDLEIDELERSMSALRFIPASVTRYQGKEKK
ncbi:hypothetical protein ASPZODRAFT_129183 [Penicilliopsis zonata CBS 506.65]|uniref:C2H2-type domain-containing protein n=1 Tax=Penicilliopsis zonata CBS 506.65 TaxID=1073090 RepID=A0A1L9SPA5_9EURO|nr:hypothetical protein ASPZODRAFT_129183 [Penicilliopsis zonata CBS 506.65]OJJ48857.1 hypothetical protein ASPZODRAFT_129183 [Penicilliopsis zonata CBS 506.65]